MQTSKKGCPALQHCLRHHRHPRLLRHKTQDAVGQGTSCGAAYSVTNSQECSLESAPGAAALVVHHGRPTRADTAGHCLHRLQRASGRSGAGKMQLGYGEGGQLLLR